MTTTETGCRDITQAQTMTQALQALSSALIRKERDGGSDYYALAEDAPSRERLQLVVMECHRGELPNDWRYETIDTIVSGLLDQLGTDDYRKAVLDAVGDAASCYSGELFSWLADHAARAEFEDGGEELCSDHLDLLELAKARQQQEIILMAHVLIDELEEIIELENDC